MAEATEFPVKPTEVKAEAPPKPKAKEKPVFKMPTVHVGQNVLWFMSQDTRKCAATVVGVAERQISLMVYTNIDVYFCKPKQAVRHVSDPDANENDRTSVGFWDYTDEYKAMERRLDGIEQDLYDGKK